MKTKKKKMYVILSSLIFITVSLLLLTSCMQGPGMMVGNSQNGEDGIEIFEVKKGDLVQEISTTGSITTKSQNDYTLQVQGEVIYALQKGDIFLKGDLLVEADPSELIRSLEEQQKNMESIEMDIETAKSSLSTSKINYQKALDENHIAIQLAGLNEEKALETSESALASLENANRSAAISYQSSEIALEQAEEMLQYANTEQEETQKEYEIDSAELKLESTKASNASSTDQAESSYEKAIIDQSSTYWNNLNSTQSAETQIRLASENIKTSELKLEQAIIKLDLAKMALQELEEDLEDYKVYAKYDGMVLASGYSEGEYASGSDGIIVIGNDVIVTTTISENDIYKISEEGRAEISLDAYKDIVFEGTIDDIIFIGEDDGGIVSYEAEISFENTSGIDIHYGLSANISIIISEVTDTAYIPLQAVYTEGGKSYVDVLTNIQADEENINKFIEKREVVTGINDYYYVEIISGLSEGEIIITSDISGQ